MLLPALLTACYDNAEDDILQEPLTYFTYTTGGENLATVTDCHPDAKNVVIPQTVNVGGTDYTVTAVFRGSGLVNVEVEEGITILPNQTFCECSSLSSVRLPSTLKDIKYMAFSNCNALKDVFDFSPTPQHLNSQAWPEKRTSATLHVPAGHIKDYEKWQQYFRTIVDDAE